MPVSHEAYILSADYHIHSNEAIDASLALARLGGVARSLLMRKRLVKTPSQKRSNAKHIQLHSPLYSLE